MRSSLPCLLAAAALASLVCFAVPGCGRAPAPTAPARSPAAPGAAAPRVLPLSDETPLADVAAVVIRDMGVLETLAIVQGRDGGFSGLSNGKSKWVYGDTVLRHAGADGSNWRDNTTSWTTDLDAADLITGFQQDTDSLGVPYEFLPHTADELTFNALHSDPGCTGDSCGMEFALWPGPVVADPARNRTLYFFSKVYRGNGVFTGVGEGLDVQTGDGPLDRPVVRPGAADPTLLFDPDETPYGSAATVIRDTLYVYGATLDFVSQDITVARVPLADALTRDAWRYYAGNGVWSPDIHAAAVIFTGHTMMSVYWNAYIGKYLAIYSKPLSNNIMIRAASTPAGPWSRERQLIKGRKPGTSGTVDYSGQGHVEYQGAGGRYEYVTYYHPTGVLAGEVRVVQVDFGAKAAGAPARVAAR